LTKLLVKKKNGKVHIREKSAESGDNLDVVAHNKLETWATFGQAAHDASGGSMEDVIANVITEMRGTIFKSDKPKVQVTESEYQSLLIQSAKKGISKAMLDSLVVIVAKKEPSLEEMVEAFIEQKVSSR